MYVNGIGLSAIERLTGVNDNTVINWVKEVALKFPDAPEHSEISGFAQVDEFETFVGKKNQIWVWMAGNNRLPSYFSLDSKRP